MLLESPLNVSFQVGCFLNTVIYVHMHLQQVLQVHNNLWGLGERIGENKRRWAYHVGFGELPKHDIPDNNMPNLELQRCWIFICWEGGKLEKESEV